MSVIEKVKSVVGLESSVPSYECVDCGAGFESATDPDSHWFRCPECGSKHPLEEE